MGPKIDPTPIKPLEWVLENSLPPKLWEVDITDDYGLAYDTRALFNELFPSIKQKIGDVFYGEYTIALDFKIGLEVGLSTTMEKEYLYETFKSGYITMDVYQNDDDDIDLQLKIAIEDINSQIEKYTTKGWSIDVISKLVLKIEKNLKINISNSINMGGSCSKKSKQRYYTHNNIRNHLNEYNTSLRREMKFTILQLLIAIKDGNTRLINDLIRNYSYNLYRCGEYSQDEYLDIKAYIGTSV